MRIRSSRESRGDLYENRSNIDAGQKWCSMCVRNRCSEGCNARWEGWKNLPQPRCWREDSFTMGEQKRKIRKESGSRGEDDIVFPPSWTTTTTTTTTTTMRYLGRDSSSPAFRRQASFSLAFFDGPANGKTSRDGKVLRCSVVLRFSLLYFREWERRILAALCH